VKIGKVERSERIWGEWGKEKGVVAKGKKKEKGVG
jgi:hypothetical protein